MIEQTLKSDGNFALFGEPFDKKQHSNQQRGLDVYVKALNLDTGEICVKKLYENTKGLHFKHTGYSPMYLKDFTRKIRYIPYQYYFLED